MTSDYTSKLDRFAELMTVAEFRAAVANGDLTDYDGFGYPVRDNRMDTRRRILPSEIAQLPADATHVLWYNR